MDNQDIHQLLAWLDATEARLDAAQGLGQENVAAARALIAELRAHADAPEKIQELLELLNQLGVMKSPHRGHLAVDRLYAPAKTGLGHAGGVRRLSPARGRCPKCGELKELCSCGGALVEVRETIGQVRGRCPKCGELKEFCTCGPE